MHHDQPPHDPRDLGTPFEFARAGILRRLVRLQDCPEQPLHLYDAVEAALDICAFAAGYVAVISTEPRQGLDAFRCDLFHTSAYNPWEAETEASTDFARLLGGFIADCADWLELPELSAAVPHLRAAMFVWARQHFAQDCDFNPPVIHHWCDKLDQALEKGEPVEAILYLRVLRDCLLADPDTGSDLDTSGVSGNQSDGWLRHDPGPSANDQPEAEEPVELSPAFQIVIESGVDLPKLEEEEALARLSRRKSDLLSKPEADPLRFAQVSRHIRCVSGRIATTSGQNATNRRSRFYLIPVSE